jgi:hypothetical protein
MMNQDELYIRILDRGLIGFGFHAVCTSWQAAIATWFDKAPCEPIAIRIVEGYVSVFRGAR